MVARSDSIEQSSCADTVPLTAHFVLTEPLVRSTVCGVRVGRLSFSGGVGAFTFLE